MTKAGRKPRFSLKKFTHSFGVYKKMFYFCGSFRTIKLLSFEMLDTLVTSKTRIKLLLKFFLNGNTSSYLRNLEDEFGESTNSIRVELNKFEQAGMLISTTEGNKKLFRANTAHPLFSDLQSIVRKYVGIDKIIEQITNRLGNLEQVYLTGSFAKGIDSKVIDLIFVGTEIDQHYLLNIVQKTESLIARKLRFLVFSREEFFSFKSNSDDNFLLIWEQ